MRSSLYRTGRGLISTGLGRRSLILTKALTCQLHREPASTSDSPGWGHASRIWAAHYAGAGGFSLPMPKSLDSIMKLETVTGLTPTEITALWNEFHIGRGSVCAVMSSQLYKLFEARAQTCSMFVLPVRKTKGFVIMVMQAQLPYVLFTGLEDYKVRGPDAAPFFAVSHYSELAETKGLVLVRGDIVLPGQLSDDEASTLLKDAHSFYLNDRRYDHVKTFNKDSRAFDIHAVLRELNLAAG